MRSSASTPSPPDGPIPLGLVLVGDDHPRPCTGRRLLRLGLVRQLAYPGAGGRSPIVLDPYARTPLSGADRRAAESDGLVAVDCSWNRLSGTRTRAPAQAWMRGGTPRRLPMLLAANPQHYGRVGELNTVEALAAALVVLGQRTGAERLLEGFAGGPAFLQLNEGRLARYASARSAEATLRAERELFGGG